MAHMHNRRFRVENHRAWDLDRPMLVTEVHPRLVCAVGQCAAVVIAAVELELDRATLECAAGDERPNLHAVVRDPDCEALGLTEPKVDLRDTSGALADRRKNMVDV